jgi:hypothetical protein
MSPVASTRAIDYFSRTSHHSGDHIMKHFLLLAGCACLLLSACSKDDSTPTTPTTTTKASDYYIPLTAGNRVVLTGTTTMKVTDWPDSVSLDTTIYTVLPTTKTSLGGKLLRAVETYSTGRTSIGYVFAGDSVMLQFDSTLAEANAETMFKTPLVVGNFWPNSTKDTTRMTIASVSETVTTGIGTLANCLKLTTRMTDPTGITYDVEVYLAKGIGIVRLKLSVSATVGTVTMTIDTDEVLKSKNF